MGHYDAYKVDVPEGQQGSWKVERFEVSEDEAKFHNLRASFSPGGRHIQPGSYTKLTRNGSIIMSDTPAEIRDHLGFIRRATGDVLIHGLGLGMVAQACLEQNEVVNRVTVVEQSKDVILLVAKHYRYRYGDRFELINADALTWQPERGRRWTCAWHDIWDNICVDNLPEMHKLHRKFGRRVEWQGSWCRELCERYRDAY